MKDEHRKIQEILIQALEAEGYHIPHAKYADGNYIGFNVYSKVNPLANEITKGYFIKIVK